jgi:hypothetical protein
VGGPEYRQQQRQQTDYISVKLLCGLATPPCISATVRSAICEKLDTSELFALNHCHFRELRRGYRRQRPQAGQTSEPLDSAARHSLIHLLVRAVCLNQHGHFREDPNCDDREWQHSNNVSVLYRVSCRSQKPLGCRRRCQECSREPSDRCEGAHSQVCTHSYDINFFESLKKFQKSFVNLSLDIKTSTRRQLPKRTQVKRT